MENVIVEFYIAGNLDNEVDCIRWTWLIDDYVTSCQYDNSQHNPDYFANTALRVIIVHCCCHLAPLIHNSSTPYDSPDTPPGTRIIGVLPPTRVYCVRSHLPSSVCERRTHTSRLGRSFPPVFWLSHAFSRENRLVAAIQSMLIYWYSDAFFRNNWATRRWNALIKRAIGGALVDGRRHRYTSRWA